jgi:hypothetical protein
VVIMVLILLLYLLCAILITLKSFKSVISIFNCYCLLCYVSVFPHLLLQSHYGLRFVFASSYTLIANWICSHYCVKIVTSHSCLSLIFVAKLILSGTFEFI